MFRFRAFFAVFLAFCFAVNAAQAATAAGEGGSERVLPKLDGVSLRSEGSLYWLQFDKSVDALWPTLIDFWANEGITLKKEQPQLGFMETEWTQDLVVDKFLSIILSDKAPVRRERFRLRVERLPGDEEGSRVFINHSAYGILFDEEAVYTGYLPASPELEVEMLSRLALYSGADKSKLKQAVSAFAVNEFQAEKINDNLYEIRVPGSVDFVQKKLLKVLDRMLVDTSTEAGGAVIATFTKKPTLGDSGDADWDIDDNSDLEETGFPDQDTDDGKPQHTVYKMVLSKDKSSAVVAVSAMPGNSDEGAGVTEFSSALARNLQVK